MDLSTMLARWKSGQLKERPTEALLGRLGKAHNAAVEKIQESRTMTPEMKRLELNEARRTFRSEWRQMRREILAGYDAELEAKRQAANPPASDAMLQRMNLLSGIHVPRWERTAGNLFADAIDFERQGEEAGLRLARQHLGVLEPGQRSKAAATIDAAISDFKTEDQRKAELEVRSLEKERDRFDLGTAMRERFIRSTTQPMNAPAATSPSPQAVPQR